MNILVTAGGTLEAIDSVRNLTNHATGSLGKVIAETFEKHVDHIFYVHGPHAILPNVSNVTFFQISSVRDLENTLHKILTTLSIHTVIHSMAVSDYEFDYTVSEVDLAERLATVITNEKPSSKQELTQLIETTLLSNDLNQKKTEKKIRSTSEQLIVALKKAPKVIHSIKQWQPTTQLIGFKLLVSVSEDDLLKAATESIKKNHAKYIVANDLDNINLAEHKAIIVDKDGIQNRCQTKQEIAESLLNLTLKET